MQCLFEVTNDDRVGADRTTCVCTIRHLYNVSITRMLVINVSIPNLTVARLEQFRSPQLPIQRERPTDAGLTENKPSFIRKPHVVISRQSPFAANVVPKLVVVATSLGPRSSLDSLTPKTYTRRIKQQVASCHTAEVISIQSLPAPPHTPRGQSISEVGGKPPPC